MRGANQHVNPGHGNFESSGLVGNSATSSCFVHHCCLLNLALKGTQMPPSLRKGQCYAFRAILLDPCDGGTTRNTISMNPSGKRAWLEKRKTKRSRSHELLLFAKRLEKRDANGGLWDRIARDGRVSPSFGIPLGFLMQQPKCEPTHPFTVVEVVRV